MMTAGVTVSVCMAQEYFFGILRGTAPRRRKFVLWFADMEPGTKKIPRPLAKIGECIFCALVYRREGL